LLGLWKGDRRAFRVDRVEVSALSEALLRGLLHGLVVAQGADVPRMWNRASVRETLKRLCFNSLFFILRTFEGVDRNGQVSDVWKRC